MRVLFIGGTGQISAPCVAAAAKAGHAVTVFNRGSRSDALPEGVDQVRGSLDDMAALGAVADRRFDVVCQFIAFTPSDIERDVALFAGKCGQYVFVSSASAYSKPLNGHHIAEDHPLGNAYWDYSASKAAAEAVLAGQSRLAYTIVRPSHTVRTQLPTALGERDLLARRLLDDKPLILPGDGNSLWTLTRAEDLAGPFIGLFGNERALGEAFNLTGDAAFSWNAIYAAIGFALGATPRIVHVPTSTLLKFNEEWRGPLLGDKAHSVTFDNRKIKSVAGDFECADDLATILADPVAACRARLAGSPEHDEHLDTLLDAIASAQDAVGRPA